MSRTLCLRTHQEDGSYEDAWHDMPDDIDEFKKLMNGEDDGSDVDIVDQEGWGTFKPHDAPLSDVFTMHELMENNGDWVAEFCSNAGIDIDDAQNYIDNNYEGCYDSDKDFVEQMANEVYEIPKYLECYIDYEKMTIDWFMCDYFSIEDDSCVQVFRNE